MATTSPGWSTVKGTSRLQVHFTVSLRNMPVFILAAILKQDSTITVEKKSHHSPACNLFIISAALLL
jgi:hypothetical protein